MKEVIKSALVNEIPKLSERTGISKEWLALWYEVEIFYGDIQKSETREQLLLRLQDEYRLYPLKEQGERSGVRKAEDHLRVYHNWMFRNYETKEVVELMKQYGEQIAFAVRDECSKATDIVIMINISQFIK